MWRDLKLIWDRCKPHGDADLPELSDWQLEGLYSRLQAAFVAAAAVAAVVAFIIWAAPQ